MTLIKHDMSEVIKKIRERNGFSVVGLAMKMGVSPSLVSLVENGREPSEKFVTRLSRAEIEFTYEEKVALGIEADPTREDEKKSDHMIGIPGKDTTKKVQSNILVPSDVNVVYTDSIFLTTSHFGVVFDIGQNMGPTNQVKIVSRIGMSFEHARALSNLLINKLNEAKK